MKLKTLKLFVAFFALTPAVFGGVLENRGTFQLAGGKVECARRAAALKKQEEETKEKNQRSKAKSVAGDVEIDE